MRIIQIYIGSYLISDTSNQGKTTHRYCDRWGDTSIPPQELRLWQKEFPEIKYREIEVIEQGELI